MRSSTLWCSLGVGLGYAPPGLTRRFTRTRKKRCAGELGRQAQCQSSTQLQYFNGS